MNKRFFPLLIVFLLVQNLVFANKDSLNINKPLFEPFIERYILDEIKDLRNNQERIKAEVEQKVSSAKLESSDRAINYTTNTVNNVFYIITAAASILVLMGWNSVRDVNKKMKETVDKKVIAVTQDYEMRLSNLEKTLKKRSEDMINAQEEIVKSNNIRGLWMRAGLETDAKELINLYDEILEINPENIEAIAYKADAVLELGEDEWALNLAKKAIELDKEYGHAYWQKACAEAETGSINDAVEDIKIAISKTPSLKSKINSETSFKNLRGNVHFEELVKDLED